MTTTLKKIYYRKLIRDHIPARLEAKGVPYALKMIDQATFENELLRKVGEEASGLVAAKTRQELIEEIADLQTVLQEVCRVKQITTQHIKAEQAKQRITKGGFKNRFFLVWSADSGYKTNERSLPRRKK